MSSALADFTGRVLSTVAPSVEPAPPRAPNRIAVTRRPMACAISRVSREPAAPTSVPATRSRVLPSR
jgi:hypothetical protein